MKPSSWILLSISSAAVGAAVFVGARALASGIPTTNVLTYSGFLEDASGAPVNASRNIAVEVWDDPTAGSKLCERVSTPTSIDHGRFSVPLDACPDVVRATPDLYIQVSVDGTALGRTKIGAVPYAIEADHAESATSANTATKLGTLTPTDVQRTLTGSCAGSVISAIAADGTVTCEPDNDTTYTASNGVSLSGTALSADTTYMQRRVASTGCAAGSSIRLIAQDGTVTCETDDNTAYTGSSGVLLSGTTFSADTTYMQRRVSGTCSTGSAIQSISSTGTVACQSTAYSAGAGLALSGSTFSVKTPLVTVGPATSTSATQTAYTTSSAYHFCALTDVATLGTSDPGTWRYCKIQKNGDGTWTLYARSGSSNSQECTMSCF